MASTVYRDFEVRDLAPILEICKSEEWLSFLENPARALRVLRAPGVVTVVAENEGAVIGFAYFQTDGEIQAHLSLIAVSLAHRLQGVGRELISYGGTRLGAARVDLVTDSGRDFYRSLPHKEMAGFRIYPS